MHRLDNQDRGREASSCLARAPHVLDYLPIHSPRKVIGALMLDVLGPPKLACPSSIRQLPCDMGIEEVVAVEGHLLKHQFEPAVIAGLIALGLEREYKDAHAEVVGWRTHRPEYARLPPMLGVSS